MTRFSLNGRLPRAVGGRSLGGIGQLQELQIRLVTWRPAQPLASFADGSQFEVTVQDLRWTTISLALRAEPVTRLVTLRPDDEGVLCFDMDLVAAEEGMAAPDVLAAYNVHHLRRWLSPDDAALELPVLCLYRCAWELWRGLMFHAHASLLTHAAVTGLLGGLAPQDLQGLSRPDEEVLLLEALGRQINPSSLLCLSATTAASPAPVLDGLAIDPRWFSTECALGYELEAALNRLGILDEPDEPEDPEPTDLSFWGL